MAIVMYHFNPENDRYEKTIYLGNYEKGRENTMELVNISDKLMDKLTSIIEEKDFDDILDVACKTCQDTGLAAGYPFCPECGMDSCDNK